ncbi:hypothetical protein BH09PLA1_BH09PLA1_21840 [soil metagenome]
MKSRRIIALSAAAALVGFNLTPNAHAVFRSWNVGTGNWGASGNWSPAGTPTAADVTFLDHLVSGQRGVVSVVGKGNVATSVSIRQLNQLDITNHSSLTVGGDILVGYDSSVGFLNVNSSMPGVIFFDGSLTVNNTLRLGFSSASGIVAQNDGTVNVNQLLRIGDRQATSPIFPGTGRYTLSGVGVLNASRLELGYGGDSSQFACEGELIVGGNSTVNISLQLPEPRIGGDGGTGTLTQTGGTINCTQRIIELGGASGPGIFNFSGGSFNAAGIGLGNTGVINYTAGANLNVGQLSTVNGRVNLSPGGGKTFRTSVLFTDPGAWAIDVSDNQMVVLSTFHDTVPTVLKRGRNGGAWNGTGITSSAARDNPQHATSLGLLSGAEYKSIYGPGALFGGQTVSDSASLIKYTLYGDADFNGVVNFDDYSRVDAGFNAGRSGWVNGDFDFNGTVNFDDYALIDLGFNAQSGTLRAAVALLQGVESASDRYNSPALQLVADHYAHFGEEYSNAFLSSVPEPAALGSLTVSALGMAARRRRRC